jgi:hypothetical protein
MTRDTETHTQIFDSRASWRIAALTLLIATGIQFGGWVYWFSGWKSTTDGAVKHLEVRTTKLESSIDHLPRTLQRMDFQQRLLVQGLNTLLAKDGGAPVPILQAPADEDRTAGHSN